MKSNPFFITGLPRSRSAWLANWLTTDQTLCYHDKPYEEYLLVNPRRVGFSGPELVTQYEEIASALPDAPWAVILRCKDEALQSFRHWAGDLIPNDISAFWETRAHHVAECSKHANAFAVVFDTLDEEPVARMLWAHLVPGIPFDLERWKLLSGLNVQQDLKKGKQWLSPSSPQ